MEPFLKWAGNPNVIIAVKAFGLKATAQVLPRLTEKETQFKFKPLLKTDPLFFFFLFSLMDLSGGGFASLCSATHYHEAVGPEFSLFCQHPCVFNGEGL